MKKDLKAIKILAIDAINQANSGHSGIAISAAPILYALYKDHLNIDINNENWINRDRFVLSAGHGSALLYSILHAFGFPYSLDDLKSFRQLGSKTPGHPEIELPFVETTTGPLGQGIANAVGMAIAERYLNSLLGDIINHHIYVVSGDGCLQEGQSYEAMSIAGNMKLNKLILLHDSNNIQIDTTVQQVNTENLKLRMKSMNWHYILVKNGDDPKSISKAIKEAKRIDKPTFIEIKTIIGKDTIWENTSKVHGKPLGEENRNLFANKIGWEYKPFNIPNGTFSEIRKALQKRTNKSIDKYNKNFKMLTNNQLKMLNAIFNEEEWNGLKLNIKEEAISTRLLVGDVLNQLKDKISLIGGSADVAGSTFVKGANGWNTRKNPSGRNIPFGVREHGMAGIANGIATYKGLKPITATFLSFADYEKPALRLSSLMNLPILSFFSHDSLFVGEDGPTHQPIEQLSLLRSIPNMTTFRPYNSQELNSAFYWYIENKKPMAIVTTRQSLSNIKTKNKNVLKGGYIFKKEEKKHKLTLIASGSEVHLLNDILTNIKSTSIRLVSVPSLCLLKRQKQNYIEQIAPKKIETWVFEASNDCSWLTIFPNAKLHLVTNFGKSGKGNEVYKKLFIDSKKMTKLLAKYN